MKFSSIHRPKGEAFHVEAEAAHVPLWTKLPGLVVIVTPERGKEEFTLVKPLFCRLRELAQGEVELMQMQIGARFLTHTSCESLLWYVANVTFAGLSRAGGRHVRIYTRTGWDRLCNLIDLEFSQP